MQTGTKKIIFGAILGVIGFLAIPGAVVLTLIQSRPEEQQFLVPGTTEITVEEPGTYYLWNDYKTVFEGKTYNRSSELPDGFEINITDIETGDTLDFTGYTAMSYETGTSSKNTIGYIELQNPTTIEIEVKDGEQKRVFSFSQSNLLNMFGLIFGGFILAMVVGLAGLGLVVWGIINLSRSKQQDNATNVKAEE